MRTLVCQDANWDEVTQSCLVEEWVVGPVWVHMLPTVDQATAVGSGMLVAVALVMATGLLLPPRDSDD